ncbi:MAG: hypothetical protein OEW66_02960 [Actinomycetota bacterium]|nr:hypothetical protein [Actinomycetota bacterium]
MKRSRSRARRSGGFVATCVLLALSVPVPANAGAPDLLWSRDTGRILSDVAVRRTSTYVTGSIRVRGTEALLVQRYGSAGGVLWKKTWRPAPVSGREPWAEGLAIAVGADGAVYVAGGASGCGDRELSSWFLRKYAPGGRLIWSLMPPTEQGCAFRASTHAHDLSVRGGLVVSATTVFGGDNSDGMLDVFSTRGRHLRTIAFEPVGPPPGSRDDVEGVAIGRRGRIYAAGWVAMRNTFDPSPDYEIAVSALRSNGGLLWSRIVRDRGARDFDSADSVSVGATGVVVAGTEQRKGCRSASQSYRRCPVAIGLDPHGRIRWRWHGVQRVVGGGAIDMAPGPRIVAAWTRVESSREFDYRVLLVRLRPGGERGWIDRWTRGSSSGVGAAGHRLSVVGSRDGTRGTVWRFAI